MDNTICPWCGKPFAPDDLWSTAEDTDEYDDDTVYCWSMVDSECERAGNVDVVIALRKRVAFLESILEWIKRYGSGK